METLRGKKSVFLDGAAFRRLIAPYDSVTVDIGAGDGKFVYLQGKRHPGQFFVGVDADRGNLEKWSAKIYKKPHKGGLSNVLYVIANAENLPPELHGVAADIRIILPWGSLMQGIIRGSDGLLDNINAIARPGARLEVILNYEFKYEAAEIQRLDLPPLTPDYVENSLAQRFLQKGIALGGLGFMSNEELRGIGSTWAGKLGHGRSRNTMRFVARINTPIQTQIQAQTDAPANIG